MLDTNIASHVIKGDVTRVRTHLATLPMASIVLSAVSKAELIYGVAKRGHPSGLATRVREFLARVDVLPWTELVAGVYGDLRAQCEGKGVTLGALDMMIAAHAKAVDAILVTHDKTFSLVPSGLRLEDWTVAQAQI